MKKSFNKYWSGASLACVIFTCGVGTSQAAVSVFNSFPNAASVNGFAYSDWNGTANGSLSWAAGPAYDAQGSTTSGSMKFEIPLDNAEQGGSFVDYVTLDESAYTAMEFDVKVDPGSAVDQYGAAIELKAGVQVSYDTNTYVYGAGDMNVSLVTTNNGWQHVIIPASTLNGAHWTNIVDVFFQCQDYNETNTTPATAIIYIDNIEFTAPDATYPNLAPATLQFNDPSSVVAVYGADNAVTGNTTSWYGETNYVNWSTNDSSGNPNSGSLYISAQFTSGNNALVLTIPFDTNDGAFATETDSSDIINASQYTAVELDVMWDSVNSTVSLDTFNSQGDIDGFPFGALDNPSWTQNEICGSTTTYIPDAASNSWQHIVLPLDNIQPTDLQMMGVWIKKYVGATGIDGTVAFWVDNITFDGGKIQTHPNQATLALNKPADGLQCNFTGTAGNASYDRETIVTFDNDYSFVDATGPVTYSIGFAEAAANSSGLIVLDQNGTAAEPDWNDASVFRIAIQTAGTGSTVTLQCKTNAPASNGDLYDSTDPTWNGTDATHTNSSPVVGTWSFTISANTNILCHAPNGATTNLAFPLSFTSADVEANFPAGGGMYVYFGAMGGGATSEGSRWVLSSSSISGGGVTPLSENWTAEANIGSWVTGGQAGPANTSGGESGNPIPGQNQAWTGTKSGVEWDDTSDSSTAYGIYLLGTNTVYSLDWTVNAGAGLTVLTNSTLEPSGWGTNTSLTTSAYLSGNQYVSEVDATNLPPSGNLFFELVNP